MSTENLVTLLIAFTLVVCIAMFSSCTYLSGKDYNNCVIQAKTAEIAKSCERVR